MKIQIVQVEIEEAVRDFIRKQITVRDGMAITMDFSATRGADGLIADIDISPAKDGSPEKEPAQAAAPIVQEPAKAVAPARAARTSIVKPSGETTAAVAGEGNTEVSQLEAGDSTRAADDGSEEVAGEAPLKTSIFSNLRRPSSGEGSETEAA